MAAPETAQARQEYLRAEARIYLTDQLAKGNTEIEQPAELWADIQAAFGPRYTVFAAAGWGWWNQAMAEHREKAQA